MSRILVLTVAVCSLLQTGLVTAQSKTDRTAVQKQIVANEKAIVDAIVNNDPKRFTATSFRTALPWPARA